MSEALGRPMEDLPNRPHVALNRTRSPARPCGSVQADDHCGCTTPAPRSDGAQLCGRPWEEKRHQRSLVDTHMALLFSPPRDGLSILDDLCNLLIRKSLENF